MHYGQSGEFLNVKTGGTYSNHEDTMRSVGVTPQFLKSARDRGGRSDSRPTRLPPDEDSWYPYAKRLNLGAHRRSTLSMKQKRISCPCLEYKSSLPGHSLVALLTEVLRVHGAAEMLRKFCSPDVWKGHPQVQLLNVSTEHRNTSIWTPHVVKYE
jgi:hypothetical protein